MLRYIIAKKLLGTVGEYLHIIRNIRVIDKDCAVRLIASFRMINC